MDTLWVVIKTAFSGITNGVTLLWLVAAGVIFGIGCIVVTCYEDKALLIHMIGHVQLPLGRLRIMWARQLASWLWVRMLRLDLERRRQLMTYSTVEKKQTRAKSNTIRGQDQGENGAKGPLSEIETELSLALRLLSQTEVTNKRTMRRAMVFIKRIADHKAITRNLANVAEAALRELEIRERD